MHLLILQKQRYHIMLKFTHFVHQQTFGARDNHHCSGHRMRALLRLGPRVEARSEMNSNLYRRFIPRQNCLGGAAGHLRSGNAPGSERVRPCESGRAIVKIRVRAEPNVELPRRAKARADPLSATTSAETRLGLGPRATRTGLARD